MDGKTARGASSPAKPALHIPDPLSTTRACTSSDCRRGKKAIINVRILKKSEKIFAN
jgi:hypothetical protein